MAFPGRTNVYDANDIRSVIPEANGPIIQICAPQLKKKSFWLVGTSEVSRVKIGALRENEVMWKTAKQTIIGTATENFESVEILGTIKIFVNNHLYIDAFVTRSLNTAPLVADGILALGSFKMIGRKVDKNSGGILVTDVFSERPNLWLPFIRRQTSIPDYMDKLHEGISKMQKARETMDPWHIVSGRLKKMRAHLAPELAQEEDRKIINILEEYSDCFYLPGDKLQPTKLITYHIKSTEIERIPATTKHSQAYWDLIENHVENLLELEVIRKSSSPHNFQVCLTEKKPNSRGNVSYRLMVDHSRVNACSEAEPFPIPSIYDVAEELHGSNYFSVVDLASAGYQIPLAADDCQKTAFSTPSGRYEFQRMPFGIKNGAEYLQRLMVKATEGLRGSVAIYHDDVLIHAPTIEDHEIAVERVLGRVRQHGLKLNPDKCRLLKDKVIFLGFLVTNEGLRPDPVKIEKLIRKKRPDNADDLRSHLGLLSTHKKFLRDYAGKSKPMWAMLKETIFEWNAEALQSYNDFQNILSQNLLLRYPNWHQSFIIKTGYSKYGIWASLLQKSKKNCKGRPIAHESRVYTPAEKLYDNQQRDYLASVYGMDTFRRYVQKTPKLPTELVKKLNVND